MRPPQRSSTIKLHEEAGRRTIAFWPFLIILAIICTIVFIQILLKDPVTATDNVALLQNDLKYDPESPSVGNPYSNVKIIVFFDYNSDACKEFDATLADFLETETHVQVIFKEYPQLSDDSLLAAKAALAVNHINERKYFAFHTSLMKVTGPFSAGLLAQKAEESDIDTILFKKTLEQNTADREIANVVKLGTLLKGSELPIIVIGNDIIRGSIDLDTLKNKVAAARDAAKTETPQ